MEWVIHLQCDDIQWDLSVSIRDVSVQKMYEKLLTNSNIVLSFV